MSAALDLTNGEHLDSDYARGMAELIAVMFLPVGNTQVAKDMVLAGLNSKEW